MTVLRIATSLGLAALLCATTSATSAQTAAAVDWQQVPTPKSKSYDVSVWDVSATSPTNAWLAGQGDNMSKVWQWDGTAWQVNSPPSDGSQTLAIASLGADDTWAFSNDGNGTTLVDHWDGLQWDKVTKAKGMVHDAVVRNATDVTMAATSSKGKPTVSIWNGSTLTSRTFKHKGYVSGGMELASAPGSTTTYVGWAGEDRNTQDDLEGRSVVYRGSGTNWSRVRLPKDVRGTPLLAAVGAKDLWMIGQQAPKRCLPGYADCKIGYRAWHLVGKTWKATNLPRVKGFHWYASVAATDSEVVVVGTEARSYARTIAAVRTNGKWRRSATPNPMKKGMGSSLTNVTAVPGGTFWAVGTAGEAPLTLLGK